MLWDSPADLVLLAWQTEVAARRVEAEAAADANAAALLAKLKVKDCGGWSAGQSKSRSQKKTEKHWRRKEAVVAAAAEAAAVAAAVDDLLDTKPMTYRGFYGTGAKSLGKRIVVRYLVPHMLINVLVDCPLLL
jgi:hypothetical protein